MRNFFSSKLNVILTVLLLAVIGAGVVLGITFFKTPTPTCADFTDMNDSEITTWASENNAEDLITIEYEYDDSVPEGQVIYQSTKAGDKLTDTCTVYISKGADPNVSYNIVINENTTLDSLKEDLSNYGITNYTVVYDESSDLDDGAVISIDPNPVSKADVITIKVAGKNSDDSSSTATKTEDDTDKVEISATGYLGYTENNFKSALNKLGFTNLEKDATGVYCPKRDKDLVASYSPDGKQSTSTKITYYLSLGAYTTELAAKEFDGLTSSKATALIKTAEFSTYGYKLETTKTSTTEKSNDTLYDCSVSGTTIACKLATNGTSSTKATISEMGYLGKTEAEFKDALTKLGFTNIVKDADGVYSSRTAGTIGAYSPDGEQPIDATITYYLSLGAYTDALAKSDFEGKTVAEANALIAKTKFSMLSYKLTTTKTTTTEKTDGTLYDCSVSGKTISCKLASNSTGSTTSTTGTSSTKATISEMGYLGKTETEFKDALTKLGFTNIVKDADGVYTSRTVGTIGAYSPDGTLPIDTKITYYLSLGPYTTALAKNDFEGKTLADANTLIAKSKFSLLSYKLSTTKTTTTSYTDGTLYDCSVSGKTISCKLASNSSSSSSSSSSTSSGTAYINPTSYANKTESEFKSALNSLGFTNLAKDANGTYSSTISSGKVAYYDPDGNQSTSTTITYWLSLGAYSSTLAANDFDGKTVTAANTILATKKYSLSGISSTVATTVVETSGHTADTLYDCSYSNKKVSCKLAKAVTTSSTAIIDNASTLIQVYSSSASYSAAETAINNYLAGQGFTNVTVKGVSSTKTAGQIISVSVGGKTDYSYGSYAKDTPIVVEISNNQTS